jgi:hypothetical protein
MRTKRHKVTNVRIDNLAGSEPQLVGEVARRDVDCAQGMWDAVRETAD